MWNKHVRRKSEERMVKTCIKLMVEMRLVEAEEKAEKYFRENEWVGVWGGWMCGRVGYKENMEVFRSSPPPWLSITW